MKYALMVHEHNGMWGPYSKWLWHTHLVCETFLEACQEQLKWAIEQRKLPGHGTTVVEYHSIDWERLVLFATFETFRLRLYRYIPGRR
jgi:hypothetical protein